MIRRDLSRAHALLVILLIVCWPRDTEIQHLGRPLDQQPSHLSSWSACPVAKRLEICHAVYLRKFNKCRLHWRKGSFIAMVCRKKKIFSALCSSRSRWTVWTEYLQIVYYITLHESWGYFLYKVEQPASHCLSTRFRHCRLSFIDVTK